LFIGYIAAIAHKSYVGESRGVKRWGLSQ